MEIWVLYCTRVVVSYYNLQYVLLYILYSIISILYSTPLSRGMYSSLLYPVLYNYTLTSFREVLGLLTD